MEFEDALSKPLTYGELSELARKQNESIERLNKSLVETQKRIRTILTSFPLGLIVITDAHLIEAVNKKTQTFFQYAPEELVGQSIDFLFPEIQKVVISPDPLKLMGRRKGGELFATEVYINDLEIYGNRRVFVHVQDITERHRLEQLKQDLVAMVSHDLRTPLTSIGGVLELIDNGVYGELSNRGHVAVARAQSSAEYLLSLVKDLLDSEKVESGTIEIELVDTTVRAIVEKAVNASQGAAKNANVAIDPDYTNDVCRADEDRIVQVLINLISNAIKYSPDNGKVRVLAGMEGLSIKFQVIDQGPGIPESMQPTIFDRYKQLDQPSGVKRQGFGLGLAICKALVEQHKGKIWVESKEGKGSKFCLTIPIDPDQ